MANISVISKESHQVLENVNSSQVGLNENSVVVVQVSKDDVASITRDNNNALINLRNGEVIVIENYFNPSFADNSLVFQDESGQLYWVKFTNEDGSIAETILYYPIEEIEPLLYSDDFIGGILPWLIGAGAAGAIAAVADNGSDSNPTPQPKPSALLNAPIVIDDVPEHIGEVADGGVTNDARPEIKGSGAQPGAIIKIYNGDELIGETVALSNGDWSFTPDQDLKDGIYELSVTQTVSGQESDKSPIKTITLDTVPPSDITIDEIGNKGETNSETPKLSGEGEPESNVEIEIKDKDGNVVDKETVPVDKDGKWEYTPEKNLDEGKYEVIVTPIDKSGNKGEEEKQEFNVDLTPPDIDIDPIPTDPEPEGWDTATNQSTFAIAAIANTLSESENNPVTTTKNQTPTFTGTTKDSESVKVVIRDSSGKIIAEGPATVTNGKWQFKSPVTLAEGDYKLEATAYDAAGNSKVATSSFTVDITPPKVTIEELPLTNIDAPTFKGKTEDGATQVRVEIKDAAGKVVQSAVVNVAADGSWTYKPSKALPDGTYSVEASARDAVGNVSQPAKTTVEVDTIDPEITIDPLEDTSDTTPEINGKTEPGATVKVEILDKDGNPVATGDATVDPEGNWTFTPTEALPEGEYTVKAEAKDKAGNVGEATSNGSFKVDTTAPSDTDVTIDPIADTNDTTPEITGTTEPGTTVNVVVKDKDGQVVAEGPATVTGDTWTYTPSVELADGEYDVVAKATDKAGNTGESQPESFEVDTVAPELTIDELKPTNDTTPTISGKTEPGATVKVEILDKDGNPVATGDATVDPEGNWTFTPTEELPEGEYTVKAEAKDAVGNTATETADGKLTVDTTDTDVAIDPIADTNDTTPEITGTTEPGTTVNVVVKDKDGQVVAEGPATVTGDTWTYTPSVELADGEYDVVAKATDQAGNTGESQPESFEVDTVAPELTIDELKPTNDTTPTISGKTEPGATVKVEILDKDGNPVATGDATVDPEGNWSFTPTEELPEGEYTVKAEAKDAVGNTATETADGKLTVDTTAPSDTDVTIDPIADTNDTTPEITGTTEPGTTVNVVVKDKDGQVVAEGPATVTGDTWTYTPSVELADGEYDVVAKATDQAGNTGESQPESFEVDTVAPELTIDELKPTNDTTPTISGKTEPGATVKVEILDKDGNPVATGDATVDPEGNWTFTPTEELPEGEYTVKAEAKDAVGNTATETADGKLTVDTTAPSDTDVTIDPIADTNDTTPEITGTTEPGTTVNVVVKDKDGQVVAEGPATVTGDTWTYTPSVELADGEYDVVAKATDQAGNTGESQPESFEVDTVAPELTIDELKPTNDTTPTISGKTEPGATVKVEILDKDGNPVATGDATVDPEGNWTFTPTEELPEGEYTVKAEAKDAVGNTATETADGKLTVDTTAPSDTDVTIDPIADTNDTTPEITGTTEPGTTVNVVVKDKDGQVVAEGPATVTGDTWTYTPSVELADGEYDVVAKATDQAGNTGESQPESFEVDTVAPELTIDELKPTNDTTPTISGKTEPGATVKVEILDKDGNPVATGDATVDPEGNWTFTPTEELPEGEYTVKAEAKDAVGNTATETADGKLTVDTTAPSDTDVTIDPIADTNDTTPEITGTTEPGTTVNVVVKDKDGQVVAEGPATVTGDTWTYTPSVELADGEYDVVAKATDQAGNTGESQPESFEVDTVAPELTIDELKPTNDTTPTISGKTEPGATVKVEILDKDGNPVATGDATVDPEGNWTFTPTEELPEGEYTVKAEAKDAVGNTATETADGKLTVDTTAPSDTDVTIDPIADTNDTTPEITGTTEPGTTVNVVVKDKDGQVVAEGPATVTGDTWTYTPSVELADGEYDVVAKATDQAGNTGESQPESFEVDTVAPELTIDELKPTNDTTPEITGKTEPGAIVDVVIKDKDGEIVSEGKAEVDPEGNWTYTPTEELPEGHYDIEVTPTDKAGNKGDTSKEQLEVDTTPPSDITIDPIGGDDFESNDPQPEITGTGEKGSLVDIVITGPDGFEEKATVEVGEDGKWSYKPEAELEEGDYKIEATPKDEAGNVGNPTEQDFVIDLTPPDIDIDPWEDDNDPWLDIDPWDDEEAAWDVSEAASVQAVSLAAEPQIAAFSAFAARSLFVAEPVVKAAQVTAVDPSLNYTNNPQRTFGGKTQNNPSQVNVEIKDQNGVVVSSGLAILTADRWSYKPSEPLADGVYVLEAVPGDKAGNSGAKVTQKFAVDTLSPDLSVEELYPTNDTTPAISGSTEQYSKVQVVIKDKNGNTVVDAPASVDSSGNWTFTPPRDLADGNYTVEVTSTDLAKNKTTETQQLTVDTQAPDAVIINPITDPSDLKPVLTGKAEANTTVELVIKDSTGRIIDSALVPADQNGNWTYPINNNLPEGTIIVEAKAIDEAGNVGPSSSIGFDLDVTPPDAPTATFNADGSLVTGTAQALSTVKVKDANNNVIGTTTADSNGNYSIKLIPSLNDGQNVYVTASDVAGESAPRQVTAPNIPLDAIDNVAKAGIEYEYPVTEKFIKDAISYNWLIGFAGFAIGKTSGATEFTIGANKTADVQLQVKSASWGTLLDSVSIVLYQQNSSGKWVPIANNKSAGLFDFIGLFGEVAHINLEDLPAGKYCIEMSNGNLASLPGYVQTNLVIKETNTSTTPVVKSITEAKGNVITDLDPIHGKDLVVSGAVVKAVNGVAINGATTIKGEFGTLTIDANGTYAYKPNANLNAIGKTDVFKYTITDPVTGKSDTAQLVLQIDSKSGSPLAWSKFTPEANANDADALANETAGKFNSTYLNETVSAKGLDKLIFNVLNDNSHNGGNGVDTINDFQLGSNVKIDVSELLSDSATAQNIDKFIFVEKDGNNTKLSIDRDGAGTTYNKVDLITFNNTDVSLQDLLNKNHLLF